MITVMVGYQIEKVQSKSDGHRIIGSCCTKILGFTVECLEQLRVQILKNNRPDDSDWVCIFTFVTRLDG